MLLGGLTPTKVKRVDDLWESSHCPKGFPWLPTPATSGLMTLSLGTSKGPKGPEVEFGASHTSLLLGPERACFDGHKSVRTVLAAEADHTAAPLNLTVCQTRPHKGKRTSRIAWWFVPRRCTLGEKIGKLQQGKPPRFSRRSPSQQCFVAPKRI